MKRFFYAVELLKGGFVTATQRRSIYFLALSIRGSYDVLKNDVNSTRKGNILRDIFHSIKCFSCFNPLKNGYFSELFMIERE